MLEELEKLRRRFLWGDNDHKRKIHWVCWEKILASRDLGGLGVGSLKALNISLLAKWIWKLKNNDKGMWCKIIRGIHNTKNKNMDFIAKKSIPGVWQNISKIENDLLNINLNPNVLFPLVVGAGDRFLFWKDKWCGPVSLQHRFPDLYSIDKKKNCLIKERISNGSCCWDWISQPVDSSTIRQIAALTDLVMAVPRTLEADRVSWALDPDEIFTVNSLSYAIDFLTLPRGDPEISWVKTVPSKVTGFVWKAVQGKIPSAVALQARGLNSIQLSCIFCGHPAESCDHILATCPRAKDTLRLIFDWCKITAPSFNSVQEISSFAANWSKCPKKRDTLIAICYGAIWKLWKARNDQVFSNLRKYPNVIKHEIVSMVFEWCKHRGKIGNLCWDNWCNSPF